MTGPDADVVTCLVILVAGSFAFGLMMDWLERDLERARRGLPKVFWPWWPRGRDKRNV
jgi:hypothetical protein